MGSGGGFGEELPVPGPSTALAPHALPRRNRLAGGRDGAQHLAGRLGRFDEDRQLPLALRCWKNNGCSTGTNGKLTVAYVEGFGENTYRQMSKMEFILQALTYPKVGKIIYRSAHSDLNQANRGLQVDDRAARRARW